MSLKEIGSRNLSLKTHVNKASMFIISGETTLISKITLKMTKIEGEIPLALHMYPQAKNYLLLIEKIGG
ncbi:hypothetical protein, partial [Cytobacillus gottheilii]|uniref:hypothetical protein n=1 Tax=Cytobacillus gottheilii TaxID=859144 RepID=UPI003605C83F